LDSQHIRCSNCGGSTALDFCLDLLPTRRPCINPVRKKNDVHVTSGAGDLRQGTAATQYFIVRMRGNDQDATTKWVTHALPT
jgi:hypothetical protein